MDSRPQRPRRARLVALVALGAIAVAIAALVAAATGGDGEQSTETAKAKRPPERAKQKPARLSVSHRGWRSHPGPVPVLMYHVVESPKPGAPLPELYVAKDEFAAEMKALARAGFQGVTADQVEAAWWRGGSLPPKPIVISFDDGYRSHYTVARPVLRRLHWPGVLSLAIANLKSRSGLTATQVKRLIEDGWEVDSHTISHSDLTTLDPKRLRHELRDSRRIIRYVFGVPAHNFTYPAGKYNASVIEAVKASGYRGALTVAPGLASPDEPFELKRIRVNPGMRAAGVQKEIAALGG